MDKLKNYEAMSVQEKWNMLSTVANLYYNADLTQSQIAERLYTSRSRVSRLLKEAREQGVVEITIQEPWERNLDLEDSLKKAFSLEDVRVINLHNYDQDAGLERLAETAAYYVDAMIEENMIIGISWGYTLYRIVSEIKSNSRRNLPITVVPIMGPANVKSPEKDSLELAQNLASAYGGKYRYLYAPLFVKSKELRNNLIQEDEIREVLDLSRKSDIILTSVGSIEYRSWEHYLSEKTLRTLKNKGAVGHIGGHFYNIEGKELSTSLADRMIGLSLKEIKDCKEVVCVAYGTNKADPVLGALRGGFINTLIIDEDCAKKIL